MSEQQTGVATDSGSSAGGSELTGDLLETCGLLKPVDKARPSPRQQDDLHQAGKTHFWSIIMDYLIGNKRPWSSTGALVDEPSKQSAQQRNTIKEQVETICGYKSQIARQKNTIDAQVDEIRRCRDTMRELQGQLEEQTHRSQNLKKLEQNFRQYQQDKEKHLVAREKQHAQDVASLLAKLELSKRNNQDLMTQVREVQAHAFNNMNGDTWTTGDDGTVRLDIENIQSRIKSWARKHAIDEMNAMPELGSEDLSSFLTLLSHVSRIDEQTSLSDTRLDPLRHLKTPRLNKKSPRICLQALLSHHIYSNIIGASFFGFEGAGALYAVYDDLLRGKFLLRRANPTGTELSQSTRRRPMPGDRRWSACYAFHPKITQRVNLNKQQTATELSEPCSAGA